MSNQLLLSTTQEIPGYKVIELKGLVKGNIAVTPTTSQGISAGIRAIKGGESVIISELNAEAIKEAQFRMELCAIELKANAVIGIRLETGLESSASVALCYGTAVIVEKI